MDQQLLDLHLNALTSPPAAPSAEVPWKEILAFGPHLLWALFLIGLLAWIGREALSGFLKNVRKVSIAGVDIEFGEEIKAVAAHRGHPVDDPTATRLSRRLARCGQVIDGAKILWVDDVPSGNSREIELVEQLGAHVIMAASNDLARVELARMRFDLILSDIGRDPPEIPKAGLQVPALAAAAPGRPPVIFYVRAVTNEPHGGFGITDRPDELLHLILDALSRRRG